MISMATVCSMHAVISTEYTIQHYRHILSYYMYMYACIYYSICMYLQSLSMSLDCSVRRSVGVHYKGSVSSHTCISRMSFTRRQCRVVDICMSPVLYNIIDLFTARFCSPSCAFHNSEHYAFDLYVIVRLALGNNEIKYPSNNRYYLTSVSVMLFIHHICIILMEKSISNTITSLQY